MPANGRWDLIRRLKVNKPVLVKGLNVIIFKVFIYLLLCVECNIVIVISLNLLVPSMFHIMHINIMDPWKRL